MAKNKKPEVKTEQETPKKVQTRYDRKMEARKKQEKKDRRDEKIFRITTRLILAVIVVGIVAGIGISVFNRYNTLHGTFLEIGERKVTGLEFDYYYNAAKNNYISTYSSLLPYMGIDVNGDFEDEPYTDTLTWRDYFRQSAAEQMREVYALVDDANASGFSYDVSGDYENGIASLKQGAASAGVSLAEYYKSAFGRYATQSNVESFMKNGYLATAYYNELLSSNAPTEEEIDAYYEENVLDYDKVDYRSFVFTSDLTEEATQEEIDSAMKELKEKAEDFAAKRRQGEDFEELCIANAKEDAKADYEDADTEYSLTEGRYHMSVPAALADWLYEEGRQEGDIEVLEDEENHQYYVVEFVKRYYDEADDESISNTIASERVEDYVAALLNDYEIKDSRGRLKYLTLPEEEGTETETQTDGTAEQ